MPSTSKKQHNFMEAIAHNPSFAKKVGVKQSVGKEFAAADKGKTFKKGSDMATKKMAKGGMTAPSKMGAVKTAAPSRDGVATKGKTKGKMIVMAGNKMCGGGMAKGKK
jgi:hypothetical protein